MTIEWSCSINPEWIIAITPTKYIVILESNTKHITRDNPIRSERLIPNADPLTWPTSCIHSGGDPGSLMSVCFTWQHSHLALSPSIASTLSIGEVCPNGQPSTYGLFSQERAVCLGGAGHGQMWAKTCEPPMQIM